MSCRSSPNKLVDGALKGMLTRLDPHSDYMTEHEYRELMATTSGQFGGVGIEISVEDGVPQVISAIEGTPAAAAGIEPGDRIVKADGQPIVGMDIGEVVRRCAAARAPAVVLTIARANRPPFDVPITRAVIHVDSVKSALKPGRIGYVRISTFDENTPAELRAAHRAAAAAGRRPARRASCSICATTPAGCSTRQSRSPAIFSIPGTVVTTRGRDPTRTAIYRGAAERRPDPRRRRWSC